jgi:hypothetical protein
MTRPCHIKDRIFTLITNEHRRVGFVRERLMVAKILKKFPLSYRLKLYALLLNFACLLRPLVLPHGVIRISAILIFSEQDLLLRIYWVN